MTKFLKKLKRKIICLYYDIKYNIHINNLNGTFTFLTGKGKFVDVIKKGYYTDIYKHSTQETIRLIPYQPNHGIFIELIKENNILKRTIFSFDDFKKIFYNEINI